jgi:hypothetical protein
MDLGRDDDLVAPRVLAQQLACDLLGHSRRIHVGGVEQVDAQFKRTPHDRPSGRLVQHPRTPRRRAERHHAQRDARDFKAARTEVRVLHGG